MDDNDRVRDHCHFTGVYRGVAQNACNLNYRINPTSWKLPIIMHNLKVYDGHLIVTSLKSEFGKVRVIPQNLEKYLSISVGRLKFLDSFQFTPQSLDARVKTLADDEFTYLAESCIGDNFELIRRKGVYPYNYMDSFNRFEETELPPKDAFFRKLSADSCSNVDYAHAVRVWDAFNHIHVGVGCGMSKVNLELITDKDIYSLIGMGIRGGVSMISTRHAKANNPSLPSYDPELPRRDLNYLDANNLYGHAMSQYLPTGGFRALSDEETQSLELENLSDDGEEGYIYEVDLHYPIELHDKHNDYPLAPQSLGIDSTMYSPTQSSVYTKSPPQKKLTPNLMDKSKYVVHYRNLKLPWLKRYIDTHQRSLSDSGFLKDFFNLMNNSVFGKTQENLWNRVKVDIITDAALIRKRVAKPSFCRGMPISDDLAIIQCKVQTITLIVQSLLDLLYLNCQNCTYMTFIIII